MWFKLSLPRHTILATLTRDEYRRPHMLHSVPTAPRTRCSANPTPLRTPSVQQHWCGDLMYTICMWVHDRMPHARRGPTRTCNMARRPCTAHGGHPVEPRAEGLRCPTGTSRGCCGDVTVAARANPWHQRTSTRPFTRAVRQLYPITRRLLAVVYPCI